MEKIYEEHGRIFQDLRLVYPVVSRRSQGLSLGINLNPEKNCNFHCQYCQVDRDVPKDPRFDFLLFQKEIRAVLPWILNEEIWKHPPFHQTPKDRQQFMDIAIAGDGEPTVSPFLKEVLQILLELKKEVSLPKIVIISNSTGLEIAKTKEALAIFKTLPGEIWAKLDAGTQEWFEIVSQSRYHLDDLCTNIANIPEYISLKIQTCLMKWQNTSPEQREIEALRTRILKISEKRRVEELQIYTIARDPHNQKVKALSMKEMQELCVPLQTLNIPIRFYSGFAD